jgi:hypothetical protein
MTRPKENEGMPAMVVDVSGEPFVDVEKEAIAIMARE